MQENEDYNNLPNCLKKYRRARGLSQKKVAQITGINSSSLICRWERSKNLPKTVVFLFKLSILYRIPIEAMFFDQYRIIRYQVLSREEKLLEKDEEDKIKKDKDINLKILK